MRRFTFWPFFFVLFGLMRCPMPAPAQPITITNRPVERALSLSNAVNLINTNFAKVWSNSPVINVLSGPYNAIPNDDEDDFTALQAALYAATNGPVKTVKAPAGRYKITQDLNIPSGVMLELEEGAIIDGTEGTYTNATVALTGGGLNELPGLGDAVSAGSRTVTFESSSGLQEGDVYILWDSDDYSFNLSREEARGGEMFRVMGVNGNTVTNTTPAFASYQTGSARKIYLLRSATGGMRGGEILSKPGTTLPSLEVEYGDGVLIEKVRTRGSRYAGFYVNISYNTKFWSCYAWDVQASVGNNYGLAYGNSQILEVLGGYYFGLRHGFTAGGGTQNGSVPCREMNLVGVTAGSEGTSAGLDFHPQCEFYTVTGGNFMQGIQVGGDYGKIEGATIGNDNLNAAGIIWAEVNGQTFHFANNNFVARKNLTASGAMIALTTRSSQVRDGWTLIHGNTVDMGDFTWTGYPSGSAALIAVNRANGSTIANINVSIKGNVLRANATNAAEFYGIRIQPVSTQGFSKVVIEGNELHRLGIRVDGNTKYTSIRANKIYSSPVRGIRTVTLADASNSPLTYWVNGNEVYDSYNAGIMVFGSTNDLAYVQGNLVQDAARANAGSPEDSGIYISGFRLADVQMNTVGDSYVANLMNHTLYAENFLELRHGLNEDLGYRWNESTLTFSTANPGVITGPTIKTKQMRWDDNPLSSLGEVELTANSGVWFRFGLVANANNGVIDWNDTHKTFAIGGSAGTDFSIPLQVLRATNSSVQSLFWNNMNGAASVNTITVRSGQTGGSGSVGIFGAADAYTGESWLAGKGGIRGFTDSAAVVIALATGQPLQIYDSVGTLLQQQSAGLLSVNGRPIAGPLQTIAETTIDCSAGAGFTKSTSSGETYTFSNTPAAGATQRIWVRITNSSGGGITPAFTGASFPASLTEIGAGDTAVYEFWLFNGQIVGRETVIP